MWRSFLETAIRCHCLVGVIVILTSCVETIPAPAEQRSAVRQAPHPGAAKLVVFRINAFKSGSIKTPVFVDGRLLGYNISGTFIVTELSVGSHVISTGVSRVTFTASEGQTYYFRQSPRLPWMFGGTQEANSSYIEAASAVEGSTYIAEGKQAAAMF
jgi:hypothetical protein